MKYENLISKMTLEEKCSLLSGGTQFSSKSIERLGIKPIMFSDGPHGVRKQAGDADHLGLNPSVPATCYPVSATVANSWDTSLAEQIGEHLGAEAAAQGISVLLGPGLNIKRNPLCGRNFEYFSEDPYLSGKMAAAYVRGIQSKGIAACPKHFAVNSQETFRMANNSVIDERTLREIYLTGFEIAVKEGNPKALMSAYNLVNGEYANDSKKLLDDILRKEWGFDGMVVTDWGGSNDRVEGVVAGNHIEMPATDGNSDREVVQAVKNSVISEELIDQRLDEMLCVWMEIILDETDGEFDKKAHHEFAKKAAEESIVLLKNEESLLPLSLGTKVAVIGDFAETPRYQGAGSSLVNSTQIDTPLNMLKSSNLDVVGYAQGFHRDGQKNDELKQEATELAQKAEVVLLYMGLNETDETEGNDRTHMNLSENQIDLLKAINRVNSNVVVVLSCGSAIEMQWNKHAKAIVHCYLGGQAGAGAAVNVLTGTVNPSGKLAESYPLAYSNVPSSNFYPGKEATSEYRESIYVGYRYYDTVGLPVAYPFGFGLSYTTFEYSNLKIDENGANFTVKNTGTVAGAEVAQLYVFSKNDTVFTPEKELKGFAKVFLNVGEEKDVNIAFDETTFRYFNHRTNQFEIAGGAYTIGIGASSRDIRLSDEITIKTTTTEQPYQKQELLSYWNGNITEVSNAEFEKLLGYPLPDAQWNQNALLEINQPIACLKFAKSPFARFVYRILDKKRVKSLKQGTPDLNILFIFNMPFRGIAKMTGGMVDMPMAYAILKIVNGHFFTGCGSLIKAFFKKRKLNKQNKK